MRYRIAISGGRPPDTAQNDRIRANESSQKSLTARSKEISVGFWTLGCDGYPIVSIGDGTDCHADALPPAPTPPSTTAVGGQLYLLASPIHGVQLPVAPLQGRAFGDNMPDTPVDVMAFQDQDHGTPSMAWPTPGFESDALGYLWKPVKAVRVHD